MYDFYCIRLKRKQRKMERKTVGKDGASNETKDRADHEEEGEAKEAERESSEGEEVEDEPHFVIGGR